MRAARGHRRSGLRRLDEGAPVIVRVGLGLTLPLTLPLPLTKAPATLDLVRIWLAEMQISPHHARVLLALLYMAHDAAEVFDAGVEQDRCLVGLGVRGQGSGVKGQGSRVRGKGLGGRLGAPQP